MLKKISSAILIFAILFATSNFTFALSSDANKTVIYLSEMQKSKLYSGHEYGSLLTIKNDGEYEFIGGDSEVEVQIIVSEGVNAKIILDNIDINSPSSIPAYLQENNSNVNLLIKGDNYLRRGEIPKNEYEEYPHSVMELYDNAQLQISEYEAFSTLTAIGWWDDRPVGIYSRDSATVTINSGTVIMGSFTGKTMFANHPATIFGGWRYGETVGDASGSFGQIRFEDTIVEDEIIVDKCGNINLTWTAMNLWSNFTIPKNTTLTIPSFNEFWIEEGATLHVKGKLINKGVMVNKGTIISNGKVDEFLSGITVSSLEFKDITEDYVWTWTSISKLVDDGIINGTGEHEFSPDNNVTRAEFITMLVRMFDLKDSAGEYFNDVKSSDYYYETVGIANTYGIIKGDDFGNFNPSANISRQDMFVIFYRALQLKVSNFEENPFRISYYDDVHLVSDYAVEAVTVLVNCSLVQGDNGKINPLKFTTRAQAAYLISSSKWILNND